MRSDLARTLKVQSFQPICPVVHLSKLFAILIAAAMLFAPFAMQSGNAMAAMTSSHHSEASSKDHCDGQPATDGDEKAADGSCCAAMCSALAVRVHPLDADLVFAPLPAMALAVSQYHSVLDELATPPPRRA